MSGLRPSCHAHRIAHSRRRSYRAREGWRWTSSALKTHRVSRGAQDGEEDGCCDACAVLAVAAVQHDRVVPGVYHPVKRVSKERGGKDMVMRSNSALLTCTNAQHLTDGGVASCQHDLVKPQQAHLIKLLLGLTTSTVSAIVTTRVRGVVAIPGSSPAPAATA